MEGQADPRDLECVICGRAIEPPLVDPMLLVEWETTPESLNRLGFLVHEACLLEVAAPEMRENITARLTAARDESRSLDSAVLDEEVVPVLYVEDAARAIAWYERLGFRKEWEHQFEPGFPLFVSVARGNVRLYLSEHKGDARPDTLIHLYVTDVETVAQEFGLTVDEEGLAGRECALEDPDGNRLRIATRRA